MPENQNKTVVMQEAAKTEKMNTVGQATEVMNASNTSTNSQNASFIPVGEVIADRFKTIEILTYNTGEATLYICEDNEQNVVAKVYHDNIKPKDKVSENIRSIQSKYVIPTLEHGVHERTNRYFEIMPYYSNGDLSTRKDFTTDFILNVVATSVNEGLYAIHQAGVVHRDIKPNNIFFGHDSTFVVLGDFGISSYLENGTVMNTGNSNRTDGYAAPEVYNQFICKENDYYSFGIMLLELALEEHPFKGFTSEQIMKVTLMDSVTIPNHIPPRLSQLIKGLTRKDRTIRWGYDEVKRWLNGENVNVAEETNTRNVRPYRFGGKDIYTLNDLALNFANNWTEGKKHLYRGLVQDFVKQFGEDYALQVIECEEIRDQDTGLFNLISALHQNPPLCWKGYIFNDLQQLGATIKQNLPEVNSDIIELLAKGNLLKYLKATGVDQSSPNFYSEIKNISNRSRSNSTLAYYCLALTLIGNSEFLYDGKVFTEIDAFISYLHDKQSKFDQHASRLLENQYFFAWLIHFGFENHIEKWRSILTQGE